MHDIKRRALNGWYQRPSWREFKYDWHNGSPRDAVINAAYAVQCMVVVPFTKG